MAKLRYRDKWHLIFCLAWLAFAILPLAPHLPSINLMLVHFPLPLLPSLSHSTDKLPQIQLDAMEMMKFPPQIHYMGTPLYWEYRRKEDILSTPQLNGYTTMSTQRWVHFSSFLQQSSLSLLSKAAILFSLLRLWRAILRAQKRVFIAPMICWNGCMHANG